MFVLPKHFHHNHFYRTIIIYDTISRLHQTKQKKIFKRFRQINRSRERTGHTAYWFNWQTWSWDHFTCIANKLSNSLCFISQRVFFAKTNEQTFRLQLQIFHREICCLWVFCRSLSHFRTLGFPHSHVDRWSKLILNGFL